MPALGSDSGVPPALALGVPPDGLSVLALGSDSGVPPALGLGVAPDGPSVPGLARAPDGLSVLAFGVAPDGLSVLVLGMAPDGLSVLALDAASGVPLVPGLGVASDFVVSVGLGVASGFPLLGSLDGVRSASDLGCCRNESSATGCFGVRAITVGVWLAARPRARAIGDSLVALSGISNASMACAASADGCARPGAAPSKLIVETGA